MTSQPAKRLRHLGRVVAAVGEDADAGGAVADDVADGLDGVVRQEHRHHAQRADGERLAGEHRVASMPPSAWRVPAVA